MADNSTIVLDGKDGNDQIKIDLRVLEVILAIAAEKVDGVAMMRGSLKSGLNWVLGREDRGKGVDASLNKDGKLTADVFVYLKSGVDVPAVAAKLQKALKTQLLQMSDLTLQAVNIHVVGLVFPEEKENKADDQLFPESEEGNNESAHKS